MAAVAALLVVMVHPIPTGAYFCAALFGLVIASMALALYSLWSLKLEMLPMPDGCFGERMLLPVRVSNSSPLPHGPFTIIEQLPFHVVPEHCVQVPGLRGRGSTVVKRDVINTRRGIFQLERLCLRATDPAGLFCREKEFLFPRVVAIYPARVHLDWLPLRLRSRQVADSTTDSLGIAGNGQEFFGVRDYRRTDSLKSIHWKATARRGRLMVREFEENAASQVSVFLDNSAAHVTPGVLFNNFEFQVTTAASVLAYLSTLYCRVLVRWGGLNTQELPYYGFCHVEQADILNGLMAVQPVKDCDPATLLNENLELIPPLSVLYCLTLHETPELTPTFAYLAGRGVEVRWLHAPAGLFARETAVPPPTGQSAPAALQPLIVGPGLDLAQVLAYG